MLSETPTESMTDVWERLGMFRNMLEFLWLGMRSQRLRDCYERALANCGGGGGGSRSAVVTPSLKAGTSISPGLYPWLLSRALEVGLSEDGQTCWNIPISCRPYLPKP